MSVNEQFVQCGRLGKTFGYQGAIHLYPASEDFQHLWVMKVLYLSTTPNKYMPLQIETLREHQDHLVVKFIDYNSKEEIASLINSSLYLPVSSLPPLPEGKFYWFELEGLEVVQVNGHQLGHVSFLYCNGCQDVLVTTAGLHIPFIWKNTILDVDLLQRKVTIDFLFEHSQD